MLFANPASGINEQGCLFLEQVVKCAACIHTAVRSTTFHPIQRTAWLKVSTEVGRLLVTDPFGLRFRTLVITAWIIEPAMEAGVQVSVAGAATVQPLYLFTALQLNSCSAEMAT